MDRKEKKISIKEGKLLLRKYKSYGLIDSAYELFKQEMLDINDYYYQKQDANIRMKDTNELYQQAVEKAFNRLSKNSYLSNIDKLKKQYATYVRHGRQGTSMQEYIDTLERFKAMADIGDFFATLSSDEVKDFYNIGQSHGLSDAEVLRRLQETYEDNLGESKTLDELKIIMRQSLRKNNNDAFNNYWKWYCRLWKCCKKE